MKMLDGVAELTLEFLNKATQAWAEIEYNRAVHRETGCSPVRRFATAPDVLRASPSSESLRDAFRLETKRSQRQSDGTISLEGVRLEIPGKVPSLPRSDRPLRPLGPWPDRSRRRTQWDCAGSDLPSR